MGDITSTIDILTRGGLVSALVLALVGGMRGWYVWKNVYDARVDDLSDRVAEITKDRDYWRDTAVRAMTAAAHATTVAERTTKTPEM